jgi:hypothetical protein
MRLARKELQDRLAYRLLVEQNVKQKRLQALAKAA